MLIVDFFLKFSVGLRVTWKDAGGLRRLTVH
jgi:hypothetical protein